jgi:hypothetical protein
MWSIDWKRDKNGINTGLFHIKTGLLGNGRKNTIFYFRKYENGISQIRKRTEKYRKRNGTVREKFLPFSSLRTTTYRSYKAGPTSSFLFTSGSFRSGVQEAGALQRVTSPHRRELESKKEGSRGTKGKDPSPSSPWETSSGASREESMTMVMMIPTPTTVQPQGGRMSLQQPLGLVSSLLVPSMEASHRRPPPPWPGTCSSTLNPHPW